ncbi:Gfo/Idh/MocA family protein [Aeromonas bivalvium]|uniref:Gfo/Idh/MocA family protein n=1 Tax=Aeromonas bivalvium TaxID=440079 RepID=UPI0038D14282
MTQKKFRVGIVGLHPGRSWGAIAHLPALQLLSDSFEVVAVANSSLTSSQAAAAATGIPHAFANAQELVANPDIDIVTITVKVPHHLELVTAALSAGKHVYCEWPLGNGLAEAKTLAALAQEKGVLGVIGTQARTAPEILYLRQLLAEGYIGDVLSSTVSGWGAGWGATTTDPETYGYLLDQANGATMLTIPFAHTLAAIGDVLGDITELSAILANRRTQARVAGTDTWIPMNAHDQVMVQGLVNHAVPLSVHYRGGMPQGTPGLNWEINGTEGSLRITAPMGHAQMAQLTLEGCKLDASEMTALPVPTAFLAGLPAEAMPGNVARIYARMAHDLTYGTQLSPTFDDGVALHSLIDTIEQAASRGLRLPVHASHRPLPLP